MGAAVHVPTREEALASEPTAPLAYVDWERKTFLVANRGGTGFHVVQPVEDWDMRVRDGHLEVGDLACFSCPAGVYLSGSGCWALPVVLHHVALHVIQTMPSPADGAGYAVEAYRG